MTKTYLNLDGTIKCVEVTRTLTRRRSDAADDKVGLVFAWGGGPYIDIRRVGQSSAEVINVCGGGSKPTIPFTQAAMIKKVDEWIHEYGNADLIHDVTNNWYV